MKSTFAAAAVMLALIHPAAHALDLGTLTSQPRVILQTLPAQVGQFSDIYTFSLSSPSLLSASGTSLDLSLMGVNLFGIDDFSILLKGSNGVTLASAAMDPVTGNYKIDDLPLMPSDYTFEVSGKTIGVAGGSYSFTGMAAPVPAVPEPSTYLMMGASLALLGLVMNKRRRAEDDQG